MITFNMKTANYLERLTTETMKLFESTKNKKNRNENGRNIPHLEITEVAIFHYKIANYYYQYSSRVLYTLVPNNSFGQLLEISTKNFVFLNAFNTEFLYINECCTDQNSKLEIQKVEDKINIALVINLGITYKNDFLFRST